MTIGDQTLTIGTVLSKTREYLVCRVPRDTLPVLAAIAKPLTNDQLKEALHEDDGRGIDSGVLIDVTIQRNYPLTLISREYGVPFGRLRTDADTIVSDQNLLHACKWNFGVHIAESEADMINEIFTETGILRRVKSVLSTGVGNILQNKRCISYLERGTIFYVVGEEFNNLPPYPCLVQHSDRSLSIELLRISEDGSCRLVDKTQYMSGQHQKATEDAEHIENHMKWAISGYPLLLDGKKTDMSEIAANVFDLRHIWQLPIMTRTISQYIEPLVKNGHQKAKLEFYFGFDRLRDKDYFSLACSNRILEFSTEMVVDDSWIDTLCRLGGFSKCDLEASTATRYSKEIHGFTLSRKDLVADFTKTNYRFVRGRENVRAPGDFAIKGKRLYVRLLPAVYPHHIVGVLPDGRLVNVSVGGLSGRSGITIEGAQDLCSDLGLTDALIFDNGFDVVCQMGSVQGTVIRHSGNKRQTRLTAALHFGKITGEVADEEFCGYFDGFHQGYCTFVVDGARGHGGRMGARLKK